MIQFCRDANLPISEDSTYYAIIEKLEENEKNAMNQMIRLYFQNNGFPKS
ncbi:hypothetical protein NST62_06975 [Ureibacillus sp. FSL K6-8385]|jgi:hypothetical protein|nr:hypothetical protein [Ureibacillus terrenus]MED3662666.1 hypothetical protein [Ureibacillus terrenus]MED3764490.1 hypothetical protein [Ureibacillus terrenus]